MVDDYEQHDERQVAAEEAPETAADRRGWAGWAISGACHGLLALIMCGVYWIVQEPEVDVRPSIVSRIDPQPPVKPPAVQTPDPNPTPVVIDVPEAEEVQLSDVVTDEVDFNSTEEPVIDEVVANRGRDDAISEAEMGGPALNMALGVGPGASGKKGIPNATGIKRALSRYGAPTGLEPKVINALRWFTRHQSPNGMWDAVNYFRNCNDGAKCEPGDVRHGSVEGANVAMTGYVLMCFLGHGHEHLTPSRHKSVVRKGIDYLLSVQKPDGLLGDRNYEHPIATMALAEAYAMTGDPALKGPTQLAVDVILARQNRFAPAGADAGYGGGFGWDYAGPTSRNDSSVTGWNIMALKSAASGGLNVGNGLEGAKRWLEHVWKAANPEWKSIDPYGESRFPYTFHHDSGRIDIAAAPAAGQPSADSHDMACVGAVAAVFLGHRAGDPMLESLVNYVDRHQMPTTYPCNTYYLYYNAMGLFQVGGERWKRWSDTVMPLLIAAQRQDACFDGSWDFQGTKFPGHETGRVLSTAYVTLTLEIYYRKERAEGMLKR